MGDWRCTSTVLNLGTRYRRVVSFTLRPLYLLGNRPWYPLGGAHSQSGCYGEQRQRAGHPWSVAMTTLQLIHFTQLSLPELHSVCVGNRDTPQTRRTRQSIADRSMAFLQMNIYGNHWIPLRYNGRSRGPNASIATVDQ
jgi:hypothetical protein